MCRNIKTLFNFEPPATEVEIQASALQFVRKLSGFNKPSQGNAAAFDRAVIEVSDAARRLLTSLQTQAPARDRETEAQKARERSRLRFTAWYPVDRFFPEEDENWSATVRAVRYAYAQLGDRNTCAHCAGRIDAGRAADLYYLV